LFFFLYPYVPDCDAAFDAEDTGESEQVIVTGCHLVHRLGGAVYPEPPPYPEWFWGLFSIKPATIETTGN
jgi:hypothetical protein